MSCVFGKRADHPLLLQWRPALAGIHRFARCSSRRGIRQHAVPMEPIDVHIRRAGLFLRRRDLLHAGYADGQIRVALAAHRIFRVRQGWYSIPDAPEAAVQAVRVGGRLTSVSALESYGLPVPRRTRVHVAVRRTASRLRKTDDRHLRLEKSDRVRVHWVDTPAVSGSVWRVSIREALVQVLIEEPRDIAVACASAVMRRLSWSEAEMDAVFERAPKEAQPWRSLISRLDDSHGETFLRLWFIDAGIAFTQQVTVAGTGRWDFQVGPHTYVEVDGGQHDPDWIGESPSSWEKGHDWDTTIAITGNRSLRYSYRQLYTDRERVLQSIERAIADDLALTAYRQRHPYRARGKKRAKFVAVSAAISRAHFQRKRRTFTTKP